MTEEELYAEYEHLNRAMELTDEFYKDLIAKRKKEHEEIKERFDGLPDGIKEYRLLKRRAEHMQWLADKTFKVFTKLYEGDKDGN